MKVLVTGANGYLGTGIVKALTNRNVKVIATDFSTDKVDKRIKRINADLFKIDDPYIYFDRPDCILHLAWRDGFVHYSDAHITDLPNHFQFVKKTVEAGIKKIVVMGSMHEVGFYEGSIDEKTPCHPQSFYGIAKNALRDSTEILTKKNNVLFQWLRGFYIVGNSEYGSSIFSKIIRSSKEGKSDFPFTMGLNQFDFIDYEVFCSQVASTIVQDKITGIINICSGRPEKLADRVERFIAENNLNIKLKYGEFPDRPYDSKAVWGNNDKINQILSM